MARDHLVADTLVEAEPFWPLHHPWPSRVIPWSTTPCQPRDGSWGDLHTPHGRRHVMAGDWIVTVPTGAHEVCPPDLFRLCFHRCDPPTPEPA